MNRFFKRIPELRNLTQTVCDIKLETRACKNCGRGFRVTLNSKQLFCSRNCEILFRNGGKYLSWNRKYNNIMFGKLSSAFKPEPGP